MIRIIPILVTAVVLSSCGGDGRTPIVVYSPHGKDMLADFERRYEAVHPGDDVRWLDMGSQDVLDRLRTERYNPQADLWWGAPMITFLKAEKEELLDRYVPSWEASVPDGRKSSAGYWYGTYQTPEVIFYNSRLLRPEEAPREWEALLAPRWRDRIIIRSPLASGTMRVIFSAIIQREARRTGDRDAGFAWLRRLDANTKVYVADPTQLYLRIAREEGMLSVWNLPDVVIQRELYSYPFEFVIPEGGTPVITDGIALVRGSRNREAAIRLYEFVTSSASLILQARYYTRIPARTDIPADSLPSWMAALDVPAMEVDWSEVAENEMEWMRRWDETVRGRGER